MDEKLSMHEMMEVNDPVIVLRIRLRKYSERMSDTHKQLILTEMQKIEMEFLSNVNQPK